MQLDAAIMRGRDCSIGAVCALEGSVYTFPIFDLPMHELITINNQLYLIHYVIQFSNQSVCIPILNKVHASYSESQSNQNFWYRPSLTCMLNNQFSMQSVISCFS